MATMYAIALLQGVHSRDSMICVKAFDARRNARIGKVGDVMPELLPLQDYAAECGMTTWLERSANSIAQRVSELERQLREAPPADRAALEGELKTWRTSLIVTWRALERSPGLVRRRVAQSAPDAPPPRLQLVE